MRPEKNPGWGGGKAGGGRTLSGETADQRMRFGKGKRAMYAAIRASEESRRQDANRHTHRGHVWSAGLSSIGVPAPGEPRALLPRPEGP